jgi:U3 small nucleolar ribonucleoprotein protein IMP4
MGLREVFLKAKELGFDHVMVISERNGNPTRMEFFTGDKEPEAYLLIGADLSPPSGKIHKKVLSLRSEEPALSALLMSFLKIKVNSEENSNFIWIKKTDQNQRIVMEFYDNKGKLIRPRIYLKDWKGVA